MSTPIKICPECDNLLYPKEDKKRKILLSACRTCSYTEMAERNRVYRNEITHITERPQILRDAYADPTLPRQKGLKCPVCNHPHVAFFLINPTINFARMYACCNPSCGHNWRADGQSIT